MPLTRLLAAQCLPSQRNCSWLQKLFQSFLHDKKLSSTKVSHLEGIYVPPMGYISASDMRPKHSLFKDVSDVCFGLQVP